MNRKTDETRYGPFLIGLHWLMLLLIVAVYLCIELRLLYPRGSEIREGLKTWHFMLGLSIFALVWLRLAVRLAHPAPRISPAPPAWQLCIAHATELAIYLFMLAMPLLGWAILSAEGAAVPYFGLQLPPLTGENRPLAEQLEEVHEIVGNVGYFLIGLHAAGALVHHYIQRDNTLSRMLPGLRNRGAASR
jgi:cytochrome b561